MVLVLDFDGVIADSVMECMVVSKKVYTELNPSTLLAERDIKDVFDKFRQLRAYSMNAGHFLPVMRAIDKGIDINSDEEFIAYASNFDKKNIEKFFRGFYRERSALQKKNMEKWLELNPPFHNIADKLKAAVLEKICIITSKDKESVKILMGHYGIPIDSVPILDNKILDKNKKIKMLGASKENISFVDDTLSNIIPIKKTGIIKCHLAVWGYNNEAQRQAASKSGINLLNEDGFGRLLKNN